MLRELDQMGIMDRVTAISSVSGGSLAAAYYVLAKSRAGAPDYQTPLSEDRLRNLFQQNFYGPILLSDLLSVGVFGGPFSTFNRTDAAGEVFDEKVFADEHGHVPTFADLPVTPQLLINASDEVNGGFPFTFIPQVFDNRLCSDLSQVNIGAAVAASAAFPLLLRSVAYKNYCSKHQGTYINLFDGGSSDNLGTDVLEHAYHATQAAKERTGKCLVIIIDAFEPFPDLEQRTHSPDLRQWYEGVLDFTSVDMATSILLERRRTTQLHEMGFCKAWDCYAKMSTPEDHFQKSCRQTRGELSTCNIWHVDLGSWTRDYQPLYDKCRPFGSGQKKETYVEFVTSVKSIPTNFALNETQIDDLFLAAYLKTHFSGNHDRVCKMFDATTGLNCKLSEDQCPSDYR